MRQLKTIQTQDKLNEVYALGDKGPGGGLSFIHSRKTRRKWNAM